MSSLNKTVVRLLAVPLEKDYIHTLYFENALEQKTYFMGKTMLQMYDCTYQREERAIRFPKYIEDMRCCNYVMYQNENDNNRWMYAFITRLEYVNDSMTRVYIETDVMQTWMFDYTLQNSYVEREHVDDDTRGLHTYPENFETGEYIINNYTNIDELSDLILVIGITALPDGTRVGGNTYNGIYSGIQYRFCDAGKPEVMTNFISSYDDEGRANAIQCLFLAPITLIPEGSRGNYKTEVVMMAYTTYGEVDLAGTGRTFSFDGYVPRNNKLFTYPYCYLLASNNNGASAVYRYEDFENENGSFMMYGAITPGCSIRLVPRNYKNHTVYDEEGLNLGKYPICNWQTDVYTNWLTQNSVNLAVSTVSNAVSIGAGIATLPFGGGASIASGLTGIASTVGQVYQQSLQPPQANGNLNCGDVITATNKNTFHFYGMCIKQEYARIIDEQFDMFGYKVCRVKTPNKGHRKLYWYTKTIDVNLTANGVPQDDIVKIKDCYNKGITFWREPSLIKFYGENPIVTE